MTDLRNSSDFGVCFDRGNQSASIVSVPTVYVCAVCVMTLCLNFVDLILLN